MVAALKLSRLTINKIKQNLVWAFGYNTIGIPIAAGILYPFFPPDYDYTGAGCRFHGT
ncbi:hypothetical protein [Methanosarcina horonobensis]|uniref:hypothetical protein n=1 Tax=Methanosarcina horonobensis TaxID=418008 RepID=UPI000A957347|nr:hypothetical protein [Methanosarcina horonobensis]